MRILVMEGEAPGVAGLRVALEREGHTVDHVHSSGAAIDLATEREYDVIVLDVADRPDDGYQVCRSLRTRRRWSPILLLTAHRHRVEQRIEGLDAGADDCLPTPFALEELSARLRALSRRR